MSSTRVRVHTYAGIESLDERPNLKVNKHFLRHTFHVLTMDLGMVGSGGSEARCPGWSCHWKANSRSFNLS
jgi:hypothetical protein